MAETRPTYYLFCYLHSDFELSWCSITGKHYISSSQVVLIEPYKLHTRLVFSDLPVGTSSSENTHPNLNYVQNNEFK